MKDFSTQLKESLKINEFLQKKKITNKLNSLYLPVKPELYTTGVVNEEITVMYLGEYNERSLWVPTNYKGTTMKAIWANSDTELYDKHIQTSDDGYNNTVQIIRNYKGDELKGTLWKQIDFQNNKPESWAKMYIPSIEELKVIVGNIQDNEEVKALFKKELFNYAIYSSSQYKDTSMPTFVYGMNLLSNKNPQTLAKQEAASMLPVFKS